MGFSLQCLFLLCITGSRADASVVLAPRLQNTSSIVTAHGLSCSTACGIFLDQGSNQCLLYWQADPLSLSHQGSPSPGVLKQLFHPKERYSIYSCSQVTKCFIHLWLLVGVGARLGSDISCFIGQHSWIKSGCLHPFQQMHCSAPNLISTEISQWNSPHLILYSLPNWFLKWFSWTINCVHHIKTLKPRSGSVYNPQGKVHLLLYISHGAWQSSPLFSPLHTLAGTECFQAGVS